MTEKQIEDFMDRLYAGEIQFVFIKDDTKETRQARGTMSPDLLAKYGAAPTPPDGMPVEKARACVKRVAERCLPDGFILFLDIDETSEKGSPQFGRAKKSGLVSYEKPEQH